MNSNVISLCDVELLCSTGIQHYDKKNYVDAKRIFSRIIQIDDKHFEAHFYLSAIYEIVGEYERAIAEFEKLIVLKEDDYDLKEFLMHLYIKRGKYLKAVSLFKKLYKNEPYSFKYWEMLIDLLLKANKFHFFLKITAVNKKHHAMCNDVILRAMLTYRDADQIQKSLLLAEVLLDIDNNNPINHYFVGTVYEAINDTYHLKRQYKITSKLLKGKNIKNNILYQEISKRLYELNII